MIQDKRQGERHNVQDTKQRQKTRREIQCIRRKARDKARNVMYKI